MDQVNKLRDRIEVHVQVCIMSSVSQYGWTFPSRSEDCECDCYAPHMGWAPAFRSFVTPTVLYCAQMRHSKVIVE